MIAQISMLKPWIKRWKRLLGKVNMIRYRWYCRVTGRRLVHFLHIGKTGGTAVKMALGIKNQPRTTSKFLLIGQPHSFRMDQVKANEFCFFVIRDPIQRFVSGFYSRKRKGLPRALHEWTPAEQKAFEQFPTPNSLAEALRDPDRQIGADAAMRSIGHVRSSYWDWLIHPDYLKAHQNQILWIGRQENLSSDFESFKTKLDLEVSVSLPTDPVKAHKNPDGLDRHLSDQAIRNLRDWYAADFQVYEQLLVLRSHIQ